MAAELLRYTNQKSSSKIQKCLPKSQKYDLTSFLKIHKWKYFSLRLCYVDYKPMSASHSYNKIFSYISVKICILQILSWKVDYLVDKPSSKLASWKGTGGGEERLEGEEAMIQFSSDFDEEEGRLEAVKIF